MRLTTRQVGIRLEEELISNYKRFAKKFGLFYTDLIKMDLMGVNSERVKELKVNGNGK